MAIRMYFDREMCVFVCVCARARACTGYLAIPEIVLLLYIFVCVVGGLFIRVLPEFKFL